MSLSLERSWDRFFLSIFLFSSPASPTNKKLKGGYGAVYRAIHHSTGIECAIKTFEKGG